MRAQYISAAARADLGRMSVKMIGLTLDALSIITTLVLNEGFQGTHAMLKLLGLNKETRRFLLAAQIQQQAAWYGPQLVLVEGQVKTLYVDYQKLAVHFDKVMRFFSLQELTISTGGRLVDALYYGDIARVLAACGSLETLDLRLNVDEAMLNCLAAAAPCAGLKHLTVSLAGEPDATAAALGGLMSSCPELTYLALDGPFVTNGIELGRSLGQVPRLRRLQLRNVSLNGRGLFELLTEMTPLAETLTDLTLRNSTQHVINLDPDEQLEAATEEAARLFGSFQNLERLHLWNNFMFQGLALESLGGLVKMTHLSMTCCYLGNDEAIVLASVIPKLPLLYLLDVKENSITEQGLTALAGAAPRCAKLYQMNLTDNQNSAVTGELMQLILQAGANGCTVLCESRGDGESEFDELDFEYEPGFEDEPGGIGADFEDEPDFEYEPGFEDEPHVWDTESYSD